MNNKEKILKLYEDNIDEIYSKAVERLELPKKIVRETERFTVSLDKKQQHIFNNILSLECEKNEVIYKNIFVEAFNLATNIILESINKSKG